ncbi:uncharacterized protein [Littorina saxatilis]|uniref:uncharacterized protein n=1 Tax=Littorina saxatilis TaxID=31220 RepID=UPI0038B64DD5
MVSTQPERSDTTAIIHGLFTHCAVIRSINSGTYVIKQYYVTRRVRGQSDVRTDVSGYTTPQKLTVEAPTTLTTTIPTTTATTTTPRAPTRESTVPVTTTVTMTTEDHGACSDNVGLGLSCDALPGACNDPLAPVICKKSCGFCECQDKIVGMTCQDLIDVYDVNPCTDQLGHQVCSKFCGFC